MSYYTHGKATAMRIKSGSHCCLRMTCFHVKNGQKSTRQAACVGKKHAKSYYQLHKTFSAHYTANK